MTALLTIAQAAADGVILAVEPAIADKLKVKGSPAAVHRWLPRLRGEKPAIIKALLEESALTGDLDSIRAWLAFIGEHDSATIIKVMEQCRTDADARAYYVWRAEEVPRGAQASD